MFKQPRATQTAIAAISRLAELHDQSGRWLTAAQIATARGLPRPVIAKTLSILARGGLIRGAPGRGGGYRLAKAPADISLLDVSNLFESSENPSCPYRVRRCGTGEQCPLHSSFSALHRLIEDYMRAVRLDLFVRAYRAAPDGGAPPAASTWGATAARGAASVQLPRAARDAGSAEAPAKRAAPAAGKRPSAIARRARRAD